MNLPQAADILNAVALPGEKLAYINEDEAELLKERGGAGIPINDSGVPSFFWQFALPMIGGAMKLGSSYMGHRQKVKRQNALKRLEAANFQRKVDLKKDTREDTESWLAEEDTLAYRQRMRDKAEGLEGDFDRISGDSQRYYDEGAQNIVDETLNPQARRDYAAKQQNVLDTRMDSALGMAGATGQAAEGQVGLMGGQGRDQNAWLRGQLGMAGLGGGLFGSGGMGALAGLNMNAFRGAAGLRSSAGRAGNQLVADAANQNAMGELTNQDTGFQRYLSGLNAFSGNQNQRFGNMLAPFQQSNSLMTMFGPDYQGAQIMGNMPHQDLGNRSFVPGAGNFWQNAAMKGLNSFGNVLMGGGGGGGGGLSSIMGMA